MHLRTELHDAAISAAKAYAHAQVEPRHVLFAIAKRFRARPEVEALFPAARQALEPYGSAAGAPTVTAEASALLETLAGETEALAALEAGVKRPRASGSQSAASAAASQESAQATAGANTAAATAKGPENIADILAELEGLIGLGAVKAQVKNVIAVVQANTERVKAGLAPVNPSLHLVFTGPPGTGKTTVARIVARLYAATGALPGSSFNEATRADLVAGYVGQTAIKTTELINRTRPGVLFIDEAYALNQRAESDFGVEAVATLVKAMEDYREEFAVIVAGYSDEMTDFVASNPGLRSRFKTYINFPDYTAEELLQIFERFAEEAAIGLAEGVRAKALQALEEAAAQPDFGNARFARSLFEQAYARMAARAASDGRVSVSELRQLTLDDIELDMESLRREQRRRIGFGDAM